MPKFKYHVSKTDEFVIENYNQAPAFSSFFPGIAGVWGCPMWVFYANRGQCITSAGIQDKNGAIIEFQPANKAYRSVFQAGFRTFLKIDGKFYEPFTENSSATLKIFPDHLRISEEAAALKLVIEVIYFTIPNEPYPALARIVRVNNLANKPRKLEIIDGLPVIIPLGFKDDLLKKTSRTTEAWCLVENLKNGAPLYRLKLMPVDISEVTELKQGHFFLPFIFNGKSELPAKVIVDPTTVFGESSSLQLPALFIENKMPPTQQTEGQLPCAFAHQKITLKKKSFIEICSLFGRTEDSSSLNQLKVKISRRSYLSKKFCENRRLINDICQPIHTESKSHAFDLYARQTFLDNVMRGGFPLTIKGKTVYVYYRKHGDMERDYNDFKLIPTYFSQGNGHYRDVNQNRRNDLFFNPEIGEYNLRRFFNLIQLDGFNPLVLLETKYTTPAFPRPFILGELLMKNQIPIEQLLEKAQAEESAVHGEGFWADHFFYNTDLLESYESIYPDKIHELLFHKKDFTFFDNPYAVASRKEKYRLVNQEVRQYESVRLDAEKDAVIKSRTTMKNVVRGHLGKGKPYLTTLAVKLLSLIANKAASFDAEGIGLELEAEKPDWYDALNGLPGLLGSSLSESLELKRLAELFLKHLPASLEITLPKEIDTYVRSINQCLVAFNKNDDSFRYWENTYQLKEAFRWETKLGLTGEEAKLDSSEAGAFLKNVVRKCNRGVKKLLQKHKNYYTYFINQAVDYEVRPDGEIKIKKFKQEPLPLFLEGFVHALKTEKDTSIYKRVKSSPLYDKKLGMYKVNAPLCDAPIEIGRAKAFTSGWLENESVWLHMEYKYLLELLKAGLYSEFFSNFKRILIPFLNPKKYGRSILENSSFIVSCAHPNRKNHGRGFYARLSGASAEFINMWVIMMTGKKIFYLNEQGKLCFRLAPILPAWLFKNGVLSFKLLGSIDVVYVNRKKKDTFGKKGVSAVSYTLFHNEKEIEIPAPAISDPYATLIRERKVSKIIVTLN